MKIGVKTFDNEKFLDYFIDKADFFEVQAIQKNNYDFLKKYKIPIVIHSEHIGFGINSADKELFKKNLESINFAIKLADYCNSKKIIIHPGIIENNKCSKQESINFIKNIDDKRILIENLPSADKGSTCTLPEEMKEFLLQTKKGFCFDINHAIQSAALSNIDYINVLKELLKLNPKHIHLGGQSIKLNKTHLKISDSDIPLKKILSFIPDYAEITLETTRDIKEVEEDLKLVRKMISEL